MRQAQYNRLDSICSSRFQTINFGSAATNPEGKAKQSLLTSVNLFGSIQLDRFVLGYSYDINTSKLRNTRRT
jgi:hypothetical protein